MAIEALPDTTVRVIGATQVLSDPASAVKELIDNALDARSTSISVEIHSNTLDSIQVRDNGHGIPPEDRQLVARPHCTSKISGEDDLKAIGGTSLGFRGEALASAAEMSGSLTISTRVEGEEVATTLKVNQQGEITGQGHASLPIGTTVKITDFIKMHPVRKQTALKNAEKTLAKIKRTLQAYAFARSHVRFSLRVLKAKNDKGNWMYAPKLGGNAEDAAFKIVGAACASQCAWSIIEERGYTLQAFVPRPDAEASKFHHIGPFISVDARPVSPERGTPKQIVKIFRGALKKANPNADGQKYPFVFVDILCPPASYDANVEPAKDDVLFEDPDLLIGMVRRLFEAVYPVQEAPARSHSSEITPARRPELIPRGRQSSDGFVTSLEPTAAGSTNYRNDPPWTPLLTDDILQQLQSNDEQHILSHPSRQGERPHQAFRSNMYACDDEDMDITDASLPNELTEADYEELCQAHTDVHISNPWIMAKMNAPLRQRPLDAEQEGQVDELGFYGLPTPRQSSPVRPQARHSFDYAESIADSEGSRLQSGQLPPPGRMIQPSSASGAAQFDDTPELTRRQPPAYNYGLPASNSGGQASGTALSAIPDAAPKRRASPKKTTHQAQLNAPFKPPLKDQPPRGKVWFDHLEQMDQRRPPRRAPQTNGLVAQGEFGDLADDPRPLTPPRRNHDMRHFFTPMQQDEDAPYAGVVERRPGEQRANVPHTDRGQSTILGGNDENDVPGPALLSGNGFVPASELAAVEGRFGPLKPDKFRPAKRRKTSEKRALREISGNVPMADQAGDDEHEAVVGDGASPVRRKTTDRSHSKSRRTKSSRLPLERVPKGQGTHNLVLGVTKSVREVSRLAGKIDEEGSLLGWNETANGAHDVFATMTDSHDIAQKLQELLIQNVSDGEMVQDLGTVVEGAFAAHAQASIEMEE